MLVTGLNHDECTLSPNWRTEYNNSDTFRCELPEMPVLRETGQPDPGTENPLNRNLAAQRNSITFEEQGIICPELIG
jgi:hypothetical protein